MLLKGANPLSRVALMFILTTPLLLSVDWLSATISLAITLIAAPLCGVGWAVLARRSWPLLFISALSGVSMLLYGQQGGHVYFTWWLMTVSDNSVSLAVAIMLRVWAVTLPVVVLARGIDPTDLGDSLAQILKLPPRFVVGAVAGVRMVSLFSQDWDSLERARRARGLGDSGRVQHVAGMSFGLLVVALRRGGKLATAMEARGFGRRASASVDGKRTWARESTWRGRDWALVLVGAVLAALPVVVAVGAGTWRLFGVA